jgi:hypothetical protein
MKVILAWDRWKRQLFRLLPEVLGWATAIFLTVFFCKVKIFQLLEELPKIFFLIFCNRMKVCVVNCFESVSKLY